MQTARWSILALASLVGGCGYGTVAVPPRAFPPSSPPSSLGAGPLAASARAASDPEKLVITGELTAVTDEVAGLVAAIDAHALEVGGSIAREEISGDAQHRQASVVLRLPPAALTGFVDWVSARATVEDRHLESTDIARELVDRDLAIANLEITMARLQELARRANAELKDVIAVEHEMTRVRGEIEKLRGAQRRRDDQVARATLGIAVRMNDGVHVEPRAKFELCPRLSFVHLVDAGPRPADRIGVGVSAMFSRWFSLELEVLPGRGGETRSYLFTMGTAMYSDFLGGGRRRFGNPYLGLRVGGATMNGDRAFAYGAEAGVELVRLERFLIEVSGRAIGLRYDRESLPGSDVILEATVGIGVPF